MKVHLYWAVALLFAGCATYQLKISEPRTLLKAGQFAKSIELFGNLAKEESKDQLIYSLDYATALQISGDYSQSAKEFIKADKLISLNDFHSVSGLVGATLGGEEMVQYKGESFEKFLLNVINSLNYVMLGQVDEAVVEARIINDKINKMRMDGRDPYEPSPFARYLSGILWESQRNFDSAYIEYEAAYKLDPLNPFIQQDLLRISRLSHRTESLQKWKNQFGGQKEDPSSVSKENGELVVIFQQGWGPEKHPSKNYRFPQLVPQFSKRERLY